MTDEQRRHLGEDLQHLCITHADALEEINVDPGGLVDDHTITIVVDELRRRHALDHLLVTARERTNVVHETEDAWRLLRRVENPVHFLEVAVDRSHLALVVDDILVQLVHSAVQLFPGAHLS